MNREIKFIIKSYNSVKVLIFIAMTAISVYSNAQQIRGSSSNMPHETSFNYPSTVCNYPTANNVSEHEIYVQKTLPMIEEGGYEYQIVFSQNGAEEQSFYFIMDYNNEL
jgi:hypothetical protein